MLSGIEDDARLGLKQAIDQYKDHTAPFGIEIHAIERLKHTFGRDTKKHLTRLSERGAFLCCSLITPFVIKEKCQHI